MNNSYLENVAQAVVTNAVNKVIGSFSDPESQSEEYSFEDLNLRNLEDLGLDDLDLVEMIMEIEKISCVMLEDSFFLMKDDQYNFKITFDQIADYVYGLMLSAIIN